MPLIHLVKVLANSPEDRCRVSVSGDGVFDSSSPFPDRRPEDQKKKSRVSRPDRRGAYVLLICEASMLATLYGSSYSSLAARDAGVGDKL